MPDRRVSPALRQALSPAWAQRSLIVALIVGTLLTVINRGDLLVTGGEVIWMKLALTYLVPFCVATYGAFGMAQTTALNQGHEEDQSAQRPPRS